MKIKALFALFEMAETAQGEPFERNRLVRFALAFLFSRSKGDRAPFDQFWKSAMLPASPLEDGMAGHARAVRLDTAFAGICLQVGENPEFIRDCYRAELIQWQRKTWPNYPGPPPGTSATAMRKIG